MWTVAQPTHGMYVVDRLRHDRTGTPLQRVRIGIADAPQTPIFPTGPHGARRRCEHGVVELLNLLWLEEPDQLHIS